MESIETHEKAGLRRAPARGTSRRPNYDDDSDDEMLLGTTKAPPNASMAARQQFKPPMLKNRTASSSGASASNAPTRPKRTPSVFNETASRRVNNTGSQDQPSTSANRSPTKRMTMQQRKQEITRAAQSTVPLGKYRSGSSFSNVQKRAPPAIDLIALGRRNNVETSIPSLPDAPRPSAHDRPRRGPKRRDVEVDSEGPVTEPDETNAGIRRAAQPFPLGEDDIGVTTVKKLGQTPSQEGALPSSRAKGKRKPQEFPVSKDEFLATAALSNPVPPRGPQAFPMDNQDLHPPRKAKPSPFDDLLNEPRMFSKPLPVDSPPRRNVQPFPMRTPDWKSSGSTKRHSESPNSQGSPARRRRLAVQPAEISYLDDDSIMVDAQVDPRDLCPFCDEPLPPQPSARLQTLLTRARRSAKPHRRLNNPFGLATTVQTLGICTVHRMESTIIPQGIQRGWPTEIDFDKLPARLENLKARIAQVVECPEKESTYFFASCVADVQSMGTLASVRADAQMGFFQRSRPGYYGERGTIHITRTLQYLFPSLSSLSATRTASSSSSPASSTFAPLDPPTFLSHVLVPEAALLLIAQDMSLSSSSSEALDHFLDSQDFGSALHPDKGEDDGDDEEDEVDPAMRARLAIGKERHARNVKEAEMMVDAAKSTGKGKARAVDLVSVEDSQDDPMGQRIYYDVDNPSDNSINYDENLNQDGAEVVRDHAPPLPTRRRPKPRYAPAEARLSATSASPESSPRTSAPNPTAAPSRRAVNKSSPTAKLKYLSQTNSLDRLPASSQPAPPPWMLDLSSPSEDEISSFSKAKSSAHHSKILRSKPIPSMVTDLDDDDDDVDPTPKPKLLKKRKLGNGDQYAAFKDVQAQPSQRSNQSLANRSKVRASSVIDLGSDASSVGSRRSTRSMRNRRVVTSDESDEM
ncbi:hypothetical protein DL93DRAFT_1673578 [Clavulina sp. PMI_390]|nr:hypothetical protein DL93DRAFT_1673578 [Clavulina sp. PMI_390]